MINVWKQMINKTKVVYKTAMLPNPRDSFHISVGCNDKRRQRAVCWTILST